MCPKCPKRPKLRTLWRRAACFCARYRHFLILRIRLDFERLQDSAELHLGGVSG